ncbi:agamous-like MADS-box protein AGL19 isoform X3 [Gossypium arboreum]|uniref:Agamous-like MADS-box protein AGL19 isoform X1 n=2 Tax=Gossypium TaxID=3633 RepID=A0A1U8PZ90_GOSHI|nr:agamous-like MADS-box protein AGL19 isoform X1 [Gossypium hirsutum]XP_052877266.1 agamous-like MADS-box protein AGL19 isoform X3 [Gossypium arboreum]
MQPTEMFRVFPGFYITRLATATISGHRAWRLSVKQYRIKENMVRGKTQMKRIENAASRQVTFSKRRNGLLKKAFELSVLCDAEVALIIFSPRGKLYEFSSSSMSKTIERYEKREKDNIGINNKLAAVDQNTQNVKEDAQSMAKKIELLEISKQKLLGKGLEPCSLNELNQLETNLEQSLSRIRERKNLLFRQQIEKLKQEEKRLKEENAKLRQTCGMNPSPWSTSTEEETMEVETELFIGPPERRRIQNP